MVKPSRPQYVQEISDKELLTIADILGSSSAASKAIAERDRRNAAGEDTAVLWDRDNGILLVGPRISEDDAPTP